MRPGRLLAKLRGRSLAELQERAAQALAAVGERWGMRGVGEPGDDEFRRRLAPAVAAAGSAALAVRLRSGERPHLVPGMAAPAATARFIAERFPERVGEIARAADDILRGRFELLGHPVLELGFPPSWSRDATLGVTAPDAHWSRIAFLDARVVGDHKVVWELNRHHVLVSLGQAWQLTGDARYARGAAALLASWLDANPPKRGVNWASSLEVAYRAVSWTWAHRLLRDAPELDDRLLVRWLKALDASARHIERYLSTWFSPNTHLTGEALGLLYIGTQFPELRDAPRWAALGWRILEEQLPRQVRPDGTYFEQAVHYHRYTLDIYLHARLLGERHVPTRAPAFDDAIVALADVLAWLSRGDGTVPLFGDDDGGQLLFLDGRAPDDVRSPLATTATILRAGRLAAVAGAPSDELAWMLGAEGVRAYDAIAPTPPAALARAFPDGGLYVMRDGWDARGAVLAIDCGPLGTANGGHAHADTLAFDLSIGGRRLFVDAGTASYTIDPAERDAMRSSLAHNTVSLDGTSSSEPAGAFRWRVMTSGVRDAWVVTSVGACFEGHHDGYRRLSAPASHRRQVLAARGEWWLVRDVIEGEGEHDAVSTFQCAPGLDATVQGGRLTVTDDGRALAMVVAIGADGGWEVDDAIVSPRYGSRERSRRARFRFRVRGTTAMSFVILRADAGGYDVERLKAATGQAIAIRSVIHDDLLLFDVRDEVEGVRTDADVAWVRRGGSGGEGESLVMVRGSCIEVDGASVASVPGGSVSATHGPAGWRVERGAPDGIDAGRRQT